MILTCKNQKDLYDNMNRMGLAEKIANKKSVLIKINLARTAVPGHPRTDISLLSQVIQYIYDNKGTCTIAESANGYLGDNLKLLGLTDFLTKYKIEVIDLDLQEVDQITVNGEKHYLPKCLTKYGLRIGIPATSKRPDAIFSNNVKLFVGAVPRRMYQMEDKIVDWRPRVHVDLHTSVANIFTAIQSYSPFHYFINGGTAMDENKGEFLYDGINIGDDGVELDLFILKKYYSYLEIPEYLNRLMN